jgi:hypothetical protein
MSGSLIIAGIGILFAGLGLGMLLAARRQRTQAMATEAWPTVGGTITASRLDRQSRTQTRQGRRTTHTTYTPVVDYTFDVGGKLLRGSKIFPGSTMSFDLGTAQDIVNRYQAGAPVTVHYNPADPTQAVLETSSRSANILMILGGVFLGIGVVMLLVVAAMALFK